MDPWLSSQDRQFVSPGHGRQDVAVEPWQSSRGRRAVAVKPWPSSCGRGCVAVQVWPSSRGRGGVTVQVWLSSRGRQAAAVEPWPWRRGRGRQPVLVSCGCRPWSWRRSSRVVESLSRGAVAVKPCHRVVAVEPWPWSRGHGAMPAIPRPPNRGRRAKTVVEWPLSRRHGSEARAVAVEARQLSSCGRGGP